MNKADFEEVVSAAIARTGELLIKKGGEYAGDADRLANFKRNAAKQGSTVLDVWQTYWSKHIDSINTFMQRVKDEATRLALEEAVDHARRLSADGFSTAAAADPIAFRERINKLLPFAVRTISAELSEPISGRFDDNINYSFLCLAILEELESDGSTFEGRPGAL